MKKKCELPGCEITFELSLAAPHKRFCCAEHKASFHAEELKRARALLRKQRLAASEKMGSER